MAAEAQGWSGLPVHQEMAAALAVLLCMAASLLFFAGAPRRVGADGVSSDSALVLTKSQRKRIERLRLPEIYVKTSRRLTLRQSSAEDSLLQNLRTVGEKLYQFDIDAYREEALNAAKTPLLVFVNRKSGGQVGDLILQQLRNFLPEWQVFELGGPHGQPERALELFREIPRFRVMVAGGDGSVAWVLASIDALKLKERPPLAILPVGTGNDLSRVLGWGGGTTGLATGGNALVRHLLEVADGAEGPLDRWKVRCLGTGKRELVLNNYLGVGVDAQISLNFHNNRERSPHLFTSSFINKYIWYASSGGKEILMQRFADFNNMVHLECDGEPVPLPPHTEGLIVLNIRSYGGGVDLWDDGLSPAEHHDGRLEVVSVASSFQLGAAQVGLAKPTPLRQCTSCRIFVKPTRKEFPIQIDGEPFLLDTKRDENSVIQIDFLNKAKVLRPPSGHIKVQALHIETSLRIAVQRKVITEAQAQELQRLILK
ncbi:Diacylglycerol kinase 2 [Hondaea fermentalgiana]|uniref:Diacylglycerol kinase n=1 Tax=Hondaea fermentalgiana TaxID=2315210 RepID=A0A2R5GIB3_9STRA|nr:Diacylglycerol kinase 2 [Hondaea fermentalgiana]|eukprot:GBG27614.1 Diacylglycerol kinase 2 [Hondaea fermentalgiana]